MQTPTEPSIATFTEFVKTAHAGEQYRYHIGELCIDRDVVYSSLSECDRIQINALADMAHEMYQRGLVRLMQFRFGGVRTADRIGTEQVWYAYLAVRTSRVMPC